MIKKLEVYEETPSGYKHPENIVQEKINELVDAVNELKTKVEIAEECLHPTAKVDPYAEQRKWVGYLCRFRPGLGVTPTYGILGEILPDSDFPYYKKDTDTYWKYCEPVKPDDDIIYKGE